MADKIHAVSAKRLLILAAVLLLIIGGNCLCLRCIGKGEESGGAACFALDCSVSMAGEKLEMAKEELRRVVADLPSAMPMSLVSFRREAEIILPATESRSELIGAAEELTASGKTGISEGLRVAEASLEGAEGKKILFLFTDGRNGEERIGKEIREELKQQGVVLFVVGMTGKESSELLDLAAESGGGYVDMLSGEYPETVFDKTKRYETGFVAAAVLESAAAAVLILFAGRKSMKKRQRTVPLPNAGYLKKEEIRKIL